MGQVAIVEIGINTEGRLYVKPALSPTKDYAFIYRDATSVRWAADRRSLYVLSTLQAPATDDWRRIRAAVEREYGDRLILTPDTKCASIPADIEQELRNASE